MLSGIAAGLAAALCQSGSYFASRHFLQRVPGGLPSLLLTSHIYMGLASLGLLACLGHDLWPVPVARYAGDVAAATFSYLLGQAGLFQALRHCESSRVASFLGLKIVLLALLVSLLRIQALGWLCWLAVGASAAAAFCLNESGGRLPPRAWLPLAVAVVGYSFSDLAITRLVTALATAGVANAALLGAALCYALCGAVAGPILLARRREPAGAWAGAVPFAILWFAGMLFLFTCFGLIGTVFGNVVQATRGVVTMGIGAWIAHRGWHGLEPKLAPALFWQRLAGALLMAAAVLLYGLGRAR